MRIEQFGHVESGVVGWLAKNDLEQIVGHTLLTKQGTNWRIVDLEVDPAFRRLGVGFRLICLVCEQVKAMLVARVTEEKDEARAFFECVGFEPAGDETMTMDNRRAPSVANDD